MRQKLDGRNIFSQEVLPPQSYYAFMSVVDKVLLEISRVIEAIFEGIEYRKAKAARGRAAKQTSAFSSSRISQHGPHVDVDNSASVDISIREFE